MALPGIQHQVFTHALDTGQLRAIVSGQLNGLERGCYIVLLEQYRIDSKFQHIHVLLSALFFNYTCNSQVMQGKNMLFYQIISKIFGKFTKWVL